MVDSNGNEVEQAGRQAAGKEEKPSVLDTEKNYLDWYKNCLSKKLTTPKLLLGIDNVNKKRKTAPVEPKVFDVKLEKAAEILCANMQQVKTKWMETRK